MRGVPVSGALALLLLGCSSEELVRLRMSRIEVGGGATIETSDPVAKNRLLRRSGSSYRGMPPGLEVLPERAARLTRTILSEGGIEVWSMDEGIVLHQPAVPDSGPAPLAEGEGCRLYFSSGSGSEAAIFMAASRDGYLFDPPRAVLAPTTGVAGARDRARVSDPALAMVDGIWHLYYAGSSDGETDAEIFCARSTDGTNWVKYRENGDAEQPTPVLPNANRDGTPGLGHPSVCVRDGIVHLWYTDRHRGAGGLWLAVSRDGLHFRDHRQVAPDIENADVKFCPAVGRFLLAWGDVNDARVSLAASADGISWAGIDRQRTIATGGPETTHHSPAFLSDANGAIPAETRVFYAGGVALPGSTEPATWEIESTWIRVRRSPESSVKG